MKNPEKLKKGDRLNHVVYGFFNDFCKAKVIENFPEEKVVYLEIQLGWFSRVNFGRVNKAVDYNSYSLSLAKLVK